MLLAIDIGNTNVVLGLFKGGELLHSWRLDSHTRRTEDEWFLLLRNLLHYDGFLFEEIAGVAVASVVPSLTTFFRFLALKHLNITPVIISGALDFDIKIKVEDPMSVGADRLCNVAGGFEKYGGPLIVIDFGTATTFDVVTANGEFIGGAIAPGLETAARILHKHAARLPSAELSFPDRFITTNTEGNMQVGIMYGTAASVEGLISGMKKELNQDCTVVATGGIGRLIVDKIDSIQHYDPELTLFGTEIIYRRVIDNL